METFFLAGLGMGGGLMPMRGGLGGFGGGLGQYPMQPGYYSGGGGGGSGAGSMGTMRNQFLRTPAIINKRHRKPALGGGVKIFN